MISNSELKCSAPGTLINISGIYWSWDVAADDPSVRQLDRYIDENSVVIRGKYISFIYELGNKIINGKSIVEHFSVGEDFSAWWMSLLAEKSIFKSPEIIECLRLFALREIVDLNKPESIEIFTADNNIADSVEKMCQSLGVRFSIIRKTSSEKVNFKERMKKNIPVWMKGALFFLVYFGERWALKVAKPKEFFFGHKTVFFFSYFIHLVKEKCSRGEFFSNQWNGIPELMRDMQLQSNWVHHYLVSAVVPNTETAVDWIEKFNSSVKPTQRHGILDSYLSAFLLIKAFIAWLRISFISFSLKGVEKCFYNSDSSVWLWPYLKKDWMKSFSGPVGAQNMIWIQLMDQMMKQLPKQKLGFFLYEGQGWERAFIHLWRKYNHEKLVAVAHSTVRHWDMRYFFDPRAFERNGPFGQPRSDVVAVNGPLAENELVCGKYPIDELVPVEAQRYLDLKVKNRGLSGLNLPPPEKKSVLLLGDIAVTATEKLLKLVESLPKNIQNEYEWIVKAHPGNPIREIDYPGLEFKQSSKPLYDLLSGFELSIGANPTSGNLDAYLCGLRVAVHVEENGLNMSPLRGLKNVGFVKNIQDLIEFLNFADVRKHDEKMDIFYSDPTMPKWRRLLAEA